MDLTKVLPWGMSAVLTIVCWQQYVKIESLEQEKKEWRKEVLAVSAERPMTGAKQQWLSKSSTSSLQKKKSRRDRREATAREKDGIQKLGVRTKNLSEEELEGLVEERAWERVEQIEEDRNQERIERIKGHIEERVQNWGDEMDWEPDIQEEVLQLMFSSFEERMAIREQVRSGEIEREEARRASEDLREERDEEIRQIIGEEQFEELEEELQRRGPPR